MNNHPIILAHGIARFDFLLAHFVSNLGLLGPPAGLAADGLHYFKDVYLEIAKGLAAL